MLKKIIRKLKGEPDLKSLKKNGLKIGENFWYGHHCWFDTSHTFLISIGNNVTFSSGVFVTAHDASTKRELGYAKIGLVEIEDNVFVGANTTILPGVKIGKGSIVGAGSVVTKSIPENSVACGCPAKVISNVSEYYEKVITQYKNLKFEKEYTISNGITDEMKKEMIEKLRANNGIGLLE